MIINNKKVDLGHSFLEHSSLIFDKDLNLFKVSD